jgi:hypothetical protein
MRFISAGSVSLLGTSVECGEEYIKQCIGDPLPGVIL